MVVLGQRHDVTLRSDLQTTAAADLHVGAFKFSNERALALEYSDMEAIAVTVADQHITGVADVDTIGEIGDVLAANTTQEFPIFIEHHYTVALYVQKDKGEVHKKGFQ